MTHFTPVEDVSKTVFTTSGPNLTCYVGKIPEFQKGLFSNLGYETYCEGSRNSRETFPLKTWELAQLLTTMQEDSAPSLKPLF